MVIQAGLPVRVWGTAEAGAIISVEFAGRTGSAKTSDEGAWSLTLPPSDYIPDHAPQTIVVRGEDSVLRIDDVLVGEVWLCSGQSNMRFTLGRQAEPRDADAPRLYPVALAGANHPRLRLLNISGGTPADRKWALCNPATVDRFSAIGYHLGVALGHARNIPVGLVDLGKGGAAIRTFMSYSTFTAHPEFGNTYKPEKRPGFTVGAVYQKDLLAFAPLAVRSVLWYQGEGDASRAHLYPDMLKLMIDDWRQALENPELPFLIVQLPPWERRRTDPARTTTGIRWAELREAQADAVKDTPNTHLAVIADLGERLDIHPRRKREVGERLARLARAAVYGETVSAYGPQLVSTEIGQESMVLTFSHTDGGLFARGGSLQDFEVAGSDGVFVSATAEITGYDELTVKIHSGVTPQYVRYAWRDYFEPTLFNGDGFPASPFRTDTFP
jgi:sialate O-acetylesterase